MLTYYSVLMNAFSAHKITQPNLPLILHHLLEKATAFLLNIIFFLEENPLQNRSNRLTTEPKPKKTVASNQHSDLPPTSRAQTNNQSGPLMRSTDFCTQSRLLASDIYHSTIQHRSNLF